MTINIIDILSNSPPLCLSKLGTLQSFLNVNKMYVQAKIVMLLSLNCKLERKRTFLKHYILTIHLFLIYSTYFILCINFILIHPSKFIIQTYFNLIVILIVKDVALISNPAWLVEEALCKRIIILAKLANIK